MLTDFNDDGYDRYDHNPVNYADVLRIAHKHTFAPRMFTTIEQAIWNWLAEQLDDKTKKKAA